MSYKPLPESLTIKPSSIEGLGLFATKVITKNTDLGMSHFLYGDFLIRTPLGGFVNHSKKPNCTRVELDQESHLKTIKEIKAGEELTLKYTMYTPIL